MTEAVNPQLSAWETYYVIVGSAGGALIGVQFVVMTLIAGMRRRASADTIGAFGTPTVVHFAGALILSAIMSAPWRSLLSTSLALATCGIGGLAYGAVVVHRARRQTGYRPVWEDWLWYAILPCSTYVALVLGALLLRTSTHVAMFLVAAVTISLLLLGIHNAWDTVTHIVTVEARDDVTGKRRHEQPTLAGEREPGASVDT